MDFSLLESKTDNIKEVINLQFSKHNLGKVWELDPYKFCYFMYKNFDLDHFYWYYAYFSNDENLDNTYSVYIKKSRKDITFSDAIELFSLENKDKQIFIELHSYLLHNLSPQIFFITECQKLTN